MTLRKRTPFTIGPEWEPVSDPHEAEALARAQFQAQVNANEQARADAKRSQQLQAMQRLLEQQEEREFRAEDQALAEQDWERKLQYEIGPRNEREGFGLAADITYKKQSLENQRQRNAALAAQGLASHRERARKAQAAEEQKLAATNLAMEQGRLEAKAKREELDRELERDRWTTKQDVATAILKQELKQLKESLASGAKDQTAQNTERATVRSSEGIGGGEETVLEKVQVKLNAGNVPSYNEIASLKDVYRMATYPETKKSIAESLRDSLIRFKVLKKAELEEEEKKVRESYWTKMEKFWSRFGQNTFTDIFKDPNYDPEPYVKEETKDIRQKLEAEIQEAIHLLEWFPGVLPPAPAPASSRGALNRPRQEYN